MGKRRRPRHTPSPRPPDSPPGSAHAVGGHGHNGGQPDLSLCMIVRDEGQRLPRCLASVQGMWDELIVVDTGSRDNTREVVRQFGGTLREIPWPEHFARARNASLEGARGRWLMWLDADDVVPPAARETIRQLARQPADRAWLFLYREVGADGASGAGYQRLFLFPNRPGLRFSGAVHEQILPAIQRAGIPLAEAPVEIHHTGNQDPAAVRDKQRRYVAIMERELARAPGRRSADALFALAGALQDSGRHGEAVQRYREAEALATASPGHYVAQLAPVRMAHCLAALGHPEEGLALVEGVLQRHPATPPAVAAHAALLLALGRGEEAMAAHATLFQLPERPTPYPVNTFRNRLEAIKQVGLYWHQRGELPLALAILRLSQGLQGSAPPPPDALLTLLRQHGQEAAIRAIHAYQARYLTEQAAPRR